METSRRMPLGSVASKILRLSPVSVLVTPIGRLGALPSTASRAVSERPISAAPSAP